VLPAEPAEGQLLIGLSGQAPSGTLSLLFLLRAESALEALGRPSPVLRWEAWCGGDWRALSRIACCSMPRMACCAAGW